MPDRLDADISADFSSGVVYRDQLERGFRQLPVDQRAVVVLHHYVGLALPEVARILDIPLGTAHSRHHRAMQAMRAALEADARIPQGEAAHGEAR